MCYAAAWWARIDRIFYGATVQDAQQYGNFDDVALYEAVAQAPAVRPLPAVEVGRDRMIQIWEAFLAMPDRPHY